MKLIRLPIQITALILQIYFAVQTIFIHTCGHAFFGGRPVGSAWYSVLFTLVIVAICEVLSLIDVILFIISKRSKYSVVYASLFAVNALGFMTAAYYSSIGTVVCMTIYALLFVLRVANLISSVADLVKASRETDK